MVLWGWLCKALGIFHTFLTSNCETRELKFPTISNKTVYVTGCKKIIKVFNVEWNRKQTIFISINHNQTFIKFHQINIIRSVLFSSPPPLHHPLNHFHHLEFLGTKNTVFSITCINALRLCKNNNKRFLQLEIFSPKIPSGLRNGEVQGCSWTSIYFAMIKAKHRRLSRTRFIFSRWHPPNLDLNYSPTQQARK